jgi:hypothetical protein
MDLTTAAKELHGLRLDLQKHLDEATKQETFLRGQIQARVNVLESAADGIDHDKVTLAKTVLSIRGTYAKAGEDRKSVISDAVKQLSTGEPARPHYGDLWQYYFGTKSYDRWHGQRSDHPYHMGPGHGSIIFSVELTDRVRKNRTHADLTADEIEAAIYYLMNLERVQAAEQRAREAAAA